MSGAAMINLSLIPAPDAVEVLDYETLLQQRKDALIALDPSLADVLAVESEPLTKLLEQDTYRELLIRQRDNDAVRAVMPAHATGADLDNLCVWRNIQRLMIDAGNAAAVPPIAPTMESDADLLKRYLLSFTGESVAGPAGAYDFHALSADPEVLDVSTTSPAPCEVVVTILSRVAGGIASLALLNKVTAALSADTVRPIGDRLTVQAAAIINYNIDASLTVYPGPDATLALTNANARLQAYLDANNRLGHDITRSGILAALHVEGVQNVNLTSPVADVVVAPHQAAYSTIINVVIGGTNV